MRSTWLAHVIGAEGWTPPTTARAAFQVLAAHQRIPADLAQRLGLTAGLRNLLVHDDAIIDPARIAAISGICAPSPRSRASWLT
jgi:uncharacterized protein YutE (UPF0331/DUF86 family)